MFQLFLRFQKQISLQQAMIWTQDNFSRIIGLIPDILVIFPLASDLFLKIPPSRKITNNYEICTHLGGNMSRGGTARGKINNFFEAPRCNVFSKKRGIDIITFGEKVFILGKNHCEGPDLK